MAGMVSAPIVPRSRRWNVVALILALASGLLIACNDQSSMESIAKAGGATANALAEYYRSLRADVLDIWEVGAFDSSIRGVSFTPETEQALAEQVVALNFFFCLHTMPSFLRIRRMRQIPT